MADTKPTFEKLPTHLAIIMDGNGRWARQRFLPRSAGHAAGVKTLREAVMSCNDLGIRYLTVYAFSSENWGREQEEVNALMTLLEQAIRKLTPEMKQNNVRLQLLGDIDRFPEPAHGSLLASMEELKECTGLTLSVCLSYGGRQEIVRAFRLLAAEGKADITPEDISSHLFTAGMPDPDLVIRTSGEYRISNFLLWQSAYAEYYFADTYWPDFHEAELLEALRAYEKRSRRFGK